MVEMPVVLPVHRHLRAEVEPIEPHIRDEDVPDDAVVVVRGGPLTAAKLVEHARREMARYTFRGRPLVSVSVDLTVFDWTMEAILRELMWSRSTYATATVGSLRSSRYELVPTFSVPHYDLLLPEPTEDAAGRLLSVFGDAVPNPYRQRGRR